MVENRKSVGVVIYREPQGGPKAKAGKIERQYLLLHYAAGHWDFPKGGVEAGESDEQTLKRELIEETGISHVELVPGFRHEFTYFFREQGKLIRKTVAFHLGRTAQADVTLSFEHKDFAWLPFAQARDRLTHKNAKELLEKADLFLNQR